jgi:Ca2+-binding RTX toxin-like protein
VFVKVLVAVLLVPALGAPLTLAGPASSSPPPARTCHGMTATIVGTTGDDRLVGTRGPDVIVGRDGNDRIDGLAGDDVLCGNDGADDLVGGRGADRLYGGEDLQEPRGRRTAVSGDLLEGGPGDDRLAPGTDARSGRLMVLRQDTVSFRRSERAVHVDLGERSAVGEGVDVVVPAPHLEVNGSRHDDVLEGSRRTEILDAGRGDDRVFGGGGQDFVLGYRGDDELHGGGGPDFVVSTSGISLVEGGGGQDWLEAGSRRPATMLGGAGFDYLSRPITAGETGVIDGGGGPDQLELGLQLWFDRDPTAALDAAAGTAVVTAGDDHHTTAFTSIDSFTLWGGPWTFLGRGADDFAQVLDGRIEAYGLGGDDYFIGAERADLLDGGEGTDAAWGGPGTNTCVDTEVGDCDRYPWDSDAVARVVLGPAITPAHDAPQRVMSRWASLRIVQRPGATSYVFRTLP